MIRALSVVGMAYDCYLENSALKNEYVNISNSNKAKQTILADILAKETGIIGKFT